MLALVFAVLSLSQGVAVVFACGIAGCGEVGGSNRGEVLMMSSSSFSTTLISYGLKTFLFVLVSIAALQFILSIQRKERKQIVIDQEQKIINPITVNSKATTIATSSSSLEHEPLSSSMIMMKMSMKQLQEQGHQHQKNEKHTKIIKKSNRNKKQRSIGGSSSKLSSASVSTCSIASAQNPAEEVETKEKELSVVEKKVDCMEKEEKDVGMELNPAAPEFIPHVPNLMKPEQQDPEFNPCFSVLRALSLFDDEKDVYLLDASL